jgi:hypothetical protein
MNVWVNECLGRWMFGFGSINVWVDECLCLGQWMFELMNVWVSECSGWWMFWVNECLGRWMFGLMNVWVDECSGRRVFGSIIFRGTVLLWTWQSRMKRICWKIAKNEKNQLIKHSCPSNKILSFLNAIRVTRWYCKKVAQNVAQPIFIKIMCM